MAKKKASDSEEIEQIEAEETEETLEETSEEENSDEEDTEEDGIEEDTEEEQPPKKYAGIFDKVEDLETAYRESSTEGQRLNGVVKTFRELVQKDAVLRERLQEQLGIESAEEKTADQGRVESSIPPEDRLALDQIKAEQEKKNRQVWYKFVERRPDFQKPEMVENLESIIPAIVEGGKKVGKTYTFNEILNVAANIIQPNERETMIDDAGIDTGSASRRTSKPKSEIDLSDQEREMAESLGLTEKEYRDGKALRK